jgi:hypothetical protein
MSRTLFVLFAQRKCRYEGEYAPEALEVVDDLLYDENPSWLDDKLEEAKNNSEFASAAVVHIELDDSAVKHIEDRLSGVTIVEGKVG